MISSPALKGKGSGKRRSRGFTLSKDDRSRPAKRSSQQTSKADDNKPAKPTLSAWVVSAGSFEDKKHFYTKVLNATVHPMVASFISMSNDRIIERYIHLNPKCNAERLRLFLTKKPRYFRWGGADLFKVVNTEGHKKMVVIETNSCPSGQKSMPGTALESSRGYHTLMEKTFLPMVKENEDVLPKGGLAVIYDKNDMETTGYAAALADVSGEKVLIAEFYKDDPNPPIRFVKRVMEVRDESGEWHPIRAAFRYVTQKPWNRIPLDSRTLIFNSPLVCLAGGRNKMAADKAYEFFNAQEAMNGLRINAPQTHRDVCKEEVPLWVRSMGGHAVVKVPYGNAGQGVYTITSEAELKAFQDEPETYNMYIVQSLVGNSKWSSQTGTDKYYHCGSIPDKKMNIFCSDLRMMCAVTDTGFRPIAIYARQAAKPLVDQLSPDSNSWEILGTNLSYKKPDGSWGTDSDRLRLMDTKDFNTLGLGLDDLIEAYIQTVCAMQAIDLMARRLTSKQGVFDAELYASINSDEALLQEIIGFPEPA